MLLDASQSPIDASLKHGQFMVILLFIAARRPISQMMKIYIMMPEDGIGLRLILMSDFQIKTVIRVPTCMDGNPYAECLCSSIKTH